MLSITKDTDAAWMQATMKALDLTTLRYSTSLYSDTTTLRMTWNLPVMSKPLRQGGSVYPAQKVYTLTATASFSSTTTVTPDYVFALVKNAVCDLPLLRTSEFDVQIEGWLAVQEELQHLVDSHGLMKCKGLTRFEPCQDCKSLYGDEQAGSKLAGRLARHNEEFREALGNDDEFDPRAFTD